MHFFCSLSRFSHSKWFQMEPKQLMVNWMLIILCVLSIDNLRWQWTYPKKVYKQRVASLNASKTKLGIETRKRRHLDWSDGYVLFVRNPYARNRYRFIFGGPLDRITTSQRHTIYLINKFVKTLNDWLYDNAFCFVLAVGSFFSFLVHPSSFLWFRSLHCLSFGWTSSYA